jgi:hypothetical protein
MTSQTMIQARAATTTLPASTYGRNAPHPSLCQGASIGRWRSFISATPEGPEVVAPTWCCGYGRGRATNHTDSRLSMRASGLLMMQIATFLRRGVTIPQPMQAPAQVGSACCWISTVSKNLAPRKWGLPLCNIDSHGSGGLPHDQSTHSGLPRPPRVPSLDSKMFARSLTFSTQPYSL